MHLSPSQVAAHPHPHRREHRDPHWRQCQPRLTRWWRPPRARAQRNRLVLAPRPQTTHAPACLPHGGRNCPGAHLRPDKVSYEAYLPFFKKKCTLFLTRRVASTHARRGETYRAVNYDTRHVRPGVEGPNVRNPTTVKCPSRLSLKCLRWLQPPLACACCVDICTVMHRNPDVRRELEG